jgi:putative SOS response-associated peptidase YedK
MSPNVCGRFQILTSGDEIAVHFRLAERFQPRPHYNVAPSQDVLTVGLTKDGQPPQHCTLGRRLCRHPAA